MIETKRVLGIAASVFSGLLLLACVMIAFLAGMWTAPWVEVYAARFAGPLPPFGEAWTMLEQMSYGPLPSSQERVYGAIRGLLATLEDPYTVLVEPQPAQQEQQRLAGRYGDVGVTLWWASAGEIGISPYPDGPAERAGVQEGDRLIAIDGMTFPLTQTLDQIAWSLQGEADTAVALTLRRSPTLASQAPLTLTLAVTREEVLHPSVSWRMPEPGVGYIRITLFTDETDSEVIDALEDLEKSASLQALILDLRGNGGGVVAVAGTFCPPAASFIMRPNRRARRRSSRQRRRGSSVRLPSWSTVARPARPRSWLRRWPRTAVPPWWDRKRLARVRFRRSIR